MGVRRMSRLVSVWFGALAVVVPLAAIVATPARADAAVDEVHYTYLGSTSISLDWRGTPQTVAYGTTSAYGSTVTGVAPQWTPPSSPGPFWQATISGLDPGTTYHYSIGGGPDYTFSTPPTGDFRFDAIGDVGDTTHFSKLGDTLSAIASDRPSFVLMVGDLTYANASDETQADVDQHFNDVMAWSTSAAYIPAWGNHEWESPALDDLRNYKGRLQMPNAQPATGSPAISCCGDDWGYFDAGGVRFISYPEPYVSATWPDWEAQANTLMRQAQNDPTIHYIVTFGHRPAYSTGLHPGDQTLAGILNSLGSSYSKYVLNINGHSHDYERFQPIDGVTHVTVGSPSSVETPWSGTDPNTAIRAMHLAHLRVDVGPSGMRLQAMCDDAVSQQDMTCVAGSVLDEYTIGVPPVSNPVTAYYVDKSAANCSDAGPGSADQPFCTIGKATSRLLPGQTVYVGNGNYAETVSVPASGTADAPIAVTAMPGTAPVVGTGLAHGIYLANRSYVTVSGLTVKGTTSDGVYLTTCTNVTLDHLDVSFSGQPTSTGFAKGMKIVATTDSTVRNSTVHQNTDSGIYLAQGSTRDLVVGNTAFGNARQYQRAAPGIDLRSGGNTVIDNVSHDNEDSGIQLYTGSDGSTVAGNILYRNGDHGVDDFQATGQHIIGNSVFHNATAGINLEGGSSGGVVENNISVDNGLGSPRTTGDIRVDGTSQSGTVVDYNEVALHAPGAYYVWGVTPYASLSAFQAVSGQDRHGIQADPRWASPQTGDFRLTAGSPAIDSADSGAPGELPVDLAGTARYDNPAVVDSGAGPRTYDDRGALEAPAGTTDASPTVAFSVTPPSGTGPLTVTADASASTDTDATPIASYGFDFGDGTATGPQAAATASHVYSTPGTYVLQATVTDSAGLSSTGWTQVVVGAAGNLVGNSGFETNLTGWASVESGCSLTRAAAGRSDGWAADLLNQNSAAQTCTLNDSPNWVTKSVAGSYTATAWVRVDTLGGQLKLRIREYAGSTLVGTVTTTATPTGDWQQLTLTYPVTSPGSSLDLNIYETAMPAASNLFIDDVALSSG